LTRKQNLTHLDYKNYIYLFLKFEKYIVSKFGTRSNFNFTSNL